MKTRTRTVELVDYREIDKIISKEFDMNYSTPAAEECPNDTYLLYTIDGILDKWDLKAVEERKDKYHTISYLNVLASNGVIPKADYLIDVSW